MAGENGRGQWPGWQDDQTKQAGWEVHISEIKDVLCVCICGFLQQTKRMNTELLMQK